MQKYTDSLRCLLRKQLNYYAPFRLTPELRVLMKKLNFQKMGGIIPAVIQNYSTGVVLMVGFMNRLALRKTLENKKVTFWSRTKNRLWEKGEVSGNTLYVVDIASDCDNDALLIKVRPSGPTCHTGSESCFGASNKYDGGLEFLQQLYDLIKDRKKKLPKNSYTSFLFKKGTKKILEKIEEESLEVINAFKNESRTRIICESADVLYHLFVMLVEKKISLKDIVKELKKRHK